MMFILMLPFRARGNEVAGVKMPDTLQAGQVRLLLNGAGVRSKYFIDAYVAGLYLPQKERDPDKIIAADAPMAVRMQIVSSLITPERMEEALRESFNNATGGNLEPIRAPLEKFISVFKDNIALGDVYEIIYQPGKGIEVRKNGVSKATAEGLEFKRACFGTWLGSRPAHAGLKKAMLGL